MKKWLFLFFLILSIALSFSITIDDCLKMVSNSPELVYDKLLSLKTLDKNILFNLSGQGTDISASLTYKLTDSISFSAYLDYDSSIYFGIGTDFNFGKTTSSENRSFWYKTLSIKLKLIDLYFDMFEHASNKEYDEDMIKYLCNIPLNKEISFDKPQFLLLKKDKDSLFKEFYDSVTYSPYISEFKGYDVAFKVFFKDPLTYSFSLSMPIHFDYDTLINSQFAKIISTKTTIIFRKNYRMYYKTLSELLKEKDKLDKLNNEYIKIYNENIQGKVEYSEVLKQKGLITDEIEKIEVLSMIVSKAAYKILVLSGEK